MTFEKLTLTAGVLCMATLVSPVIFAEPTGWYVGAGGGQSRTNADAYDIHPGLKLEGPTAVDEDDSSTGWKAFGGYWLNQNFAIEGSYVDLGEFKADAIVTLPVPGTSKYTVEPKMWCLSGVGNYPFENSFSLYGKAGICYWDDNASGSHYPGGDPHDIEDYSDGTDAMFGIGAGYDFGNKFAIRAEWERYLNVVHDKADADLFSVNLLYNF